MSSYVGSTSVSKYYVGSTAVDKVYVGTTQIYSAASYILDTIPGAVAIYSPRKMKALHILSMRVRRSSDQLEQDFGFVGDDLDTASLLAFVGSGSGYLVTYYDASGNSNHAYNVSPSQQPRIVNAGVLEVENLKPCVVFSGSQVLRITNSTSVDITTLPLSINMVIKPLVGGYALSKNTDASANNQYAVFYNSGGNQYFQFALQGSFVQNSDVGSFPTTSYKIYTQVAKAGEQKSYANGSVSGATGTYNGTLTSRTYMQIGARSTVPTGDSWSSFISARIGEIIIFNTELTTLQRQALENNQKAYYGI